LDINGSNRYLFTGGYYVGIDLVSGKNVDILCPIHDMVGEWEVVISTECLEHDQYWIDSIRNMVEILKPGGLLIVTCAGRNRPIHGTFDETPEDSPGTNHYYRNLTPDDVKSAVNFDEAFIDYEITESAAGRDLCFWGIKR
jgi:SAM-dependent methyltransferase